MCTKQPSVRSKPSPCVGGVRTETIARPGTGKEGASASEYTRGTRRYWWSFWPHASVSASGPWMDMVVGIPGLRDSAWAHPLPCLGPSSGASSTLVGPDPPNQRCWHEGPHCPWQIKGQRQELSQTWVCCLSQLGLKPTGYKGEGTQGPMREGGSYGGFPELPSAAQPRSGRSRGSRGEEGQEEVRYS